jgi:hypothetical protein
MFKGLTARRLSRSALMSLMNLRDPYNAGGFWTIRGTVHLLKDSVPVRQLFGRRQVLSNKNIPQLGFEPTIRVSRCT